MLPPRVSVICTFLNRESFLGEAVDSVLAQDFADWELLLVDDGSRDGSSALAADHARRDSRIRVLSHEGHINRGISASRNLGLAQARGQFIAFIDSDDVWLPGKLSGQVALFDAMPDIDMVCGRVNYWSSWDGGEDDHIQTGGVRDAVLEPPGTLLALYPVGPAGAPSPSEVMLRASAIARIGGFDEAFPGYYDDMILFAKAYLHLRIFSADRLWVHYRIHGGSCTADTRRRRDYVPRRRQFFEWLSAYLARSDVTATPAMRAAVARELRLLRHPLAWKLKWRLDRLLAAARARQSA
ncbi:MAG: putative glycosyltransferase EpsE [Pseudomonadota bacterium]|jgi:glycosyltransferase involved in cell wall biosynthesis